MRTVCYQDVWIETPAFTAGLKRFRARERERSDGSWDYGLTFIFPRPPQKTGTARRELRKWLAPVFQLPT
jgi:hypothetical protein